MHETDLQEGFESLSTDRIGEELHRARVVSSSGKSRLERIPGNPERRDYLSTASFRVYSGRKAVCHLTVGRSLAGLYKRVQSFATACPALACKPLFYHKSGPWDYVGMELFEGRSVESMVLTGDLSSHKALAHADEALGALETTMRASNVAAADQELERVFGAARSSPMFGGLDQKFLTEVIFPFVRKGAFEGPQRSRWSNGDFTPSNLLVGAKGSLRLVDYEFAARTHFFVEDFWRWRTFSTLPAEAKGFGDTHGCDATSAWSEAYFILRQLVISHEVNGAHAAVADARQWTDRLLALVSSAHFGFRANIFYRTMAEAARQAVPPVPESSRATAQLFWSANGEFSEEKSSRAEYNLGDEATLRFRLQAMRGVLQLRFDPADSIGLLQISAIRVRAMHQSSALLAFDSASGWSDLRLGSELLRLPDSPALNLLCLGKDPMILLPEIDLGAEGTDLLCEVWLSFTPRITALPSYLQVPLLPLGETRVPELELRSRELQDALTERQLEIEQATGRTAALEATIGELREQVGRLEQSISEVTEALKQRDANILELNNRANEAKASLEAAAAGRTVKEAELEALRKELAGRKTESEQAAARLAEATAKASSDAVLHTRKEMELEATIVELHSDLLESKKASQAVLAQRQADLEQVASKLAVAEAASGARIRDLEAQRESAASRIGAEGDLRKQKEAELDNARRELLQRSADLEKAGARIAALEASSEASIRDLEGKLAEAASRIGAEGDLRKQKEAELDNARRELLQRSADLEKAGARIAALEASSEASIRDLEGKLAEAASRIGAEGDLRKQKEAELDNARRELLQRSADLEKAGARIAALEASSEAKARELEGKLAKATARMEAEKAQRVAENEAFESERKALVLQQHHLEIASRELAAQVEERSAEVQELGSRLREAVERADASAARAASKERELEATIVEMHGSMLAARKASQDELQERAGEIARLTETAARQVDSLQAQNEEIRRLESLTRDASAALAVLRDRLESSEKWLADLRSRASVKLSMALHGEKWPL